MSGSYRGSQHDGGDSSDVQEHLVFVEQIQARRCDV